ncbi:TonB-dependent receptor [Mucilaginibacter sp. Bleaf8]|uniref:TonB-dependent receptor plug domain-containing protein n=1 Tax=Mucilaginibacter sp. Bleaf8 TaxID=2834430 RepID=UPI001BCEFEDF|nr:TonB-dependent receptor [Mucilaginibacter sp. Bleaf8]MBS7562823.1 TonB-dependent receptor [Mucilaginibacter sp. Bleaf8]
MEFNMLFAPVRTGRHLLYQKIALCLAATLLCCPKVWAQSRRADTAATAKVHELQQVNINAVKDRIIQPSITPVQRLSSTRLERMSSFSVADAIRFLTGVQLKDYGGIGGLKTVNVRSMGTNHTAVFYDGVQLGNVQNGQVDLGRFSLDNIEEISLYNGQRSEISQPARAFAAASAIYLQSKIPTFRPGEHTHLRAGFKTGSFGLWNPSILWEQKLTNRVSASVSSELVQTDGRYKFRSSNGVFDTTASRSNTDVASYRVEGGLNGTLPDSSTWRVKAYAFVANRGLPGPVVSNKFDYPQRQWDRNLFLQGSYNSNVNKRFSFILNAKYANDYLRYLDPETVKKTGFSDNHFYQHEFYFSWANRYRLTGAWDVALSSDYQWNNLDADLYRFAYPTRYMLQTVLASELKLKDISLQGSLLHTWVNDVVKAFASAGRKQKLTPSLLMSWQPGGQQDVTLRAFYKNIFRLPTLNDLYYTTIGNTQLKPEWAKQYDVGITYNHTYQQQAFAYLSVQADVYYNQVRDKIVAIPGANLFRWTMYNIGNVAIKGFETTIQSAWNTGSEIVLNAGVNYTYQQSRDVTDGQKSRYNIPYIPTHSGSVTLGADYRQLSINYSYLYVGNRYDQLSTDQNQVYNYMEPYYTHDVTLGYHTMLHRKPIKLGLEINNIFNQDRELITNFPLPRRFYRIKISYTI